MRAVGIDFGTTNSAVAVAEEDGQVRSLSWPSAAGSVDVFRTALAFWSEGRAPRAVLRTAGGPQALEHALSGTGQGRLIQSIKTYLGSRAFTDTRLYGQRFTLPNLVSTFLRHLVPDRDALLSEAAAVVAGRPVVFAGENPDEALAVERLGTAFAEAGFGTVELAYEPLGAAYWYARNLRRDETVLVADFGGGTSDFSVIRFERVGVGFEATPLTHGGVGIAGDTFDYRLIDRYVAPQLGRGSHYRSFDKLLPIPALYPCGIQPVAPAVMAESPPHLGGAEETQGRQRRSGRHGAVDRLHRPRPRFRALRRDQRGQDPAVGGRAHALRVRHRRHPLEADVTRAEFERLIAPDLARIAAAADDTLARAGLGYGDIDAVFTTGGTSQVPAVRRLFVERFGADLLHTAHPLQSVASGLALYAADRARGRGPGVAASA